MRSGGTYDVSGYKPLYAIDTPPLKIASMLLLQVALLFVISVVFAPVAKTNIHRIAALMTAGLALFAIIAIGINELGTTHYRFRTYRAELGGSLDITITNGDSTIAPIPFLQITNSEAIDVWSLSGFLAMFDYDPAEQLDEIPSIDEKFMTTLCMAKGTYVGDLDVFDANQDRLVGHYDWYQLDQLESGTYYIIATLIEDGDPGLRHGWYLFILNVE